MSRPLPIPAGTRPVVEELPEQDQDALEVVREQLPSWLSSLVLHLSFVLLLALVRVAGGGFGGHGNTMSCEVGGGGGEVGAGQLEESLATPSELTETGTMATAPTTPISEALDATTPKLEDLTPQIDAPQMLSSVAGIAALDKGSGGGSGGGSGKGVGTDNGDGDGGGFGPGSSPTSTNIFGLADEGSNFVYVFDRSDSMNSTLSYQSEGSTVTVTPLQAAKAELLRSIEDLNQLHRFHIIFYNHEPWLFDPGRPTRRLIQATKENRRRAAQFVNDVYGTGNTRHLEPLEMALKMQPDVIFLLTDGEAKDDPSPEQIQHLLKMNKGRTKINVIQFCYTPREDGTLLQLAKQSGGKHIFMSLARLGPGINPVP